MNERIKLMARQSGATDQDGSMATTVFCFTEMELEKFAELIVKECAQVAFEGDLKRAIGQWGSHSDILIHFGIEHDVVKKFRGEE